MPDYIDRRNQAPSKDVRRSMRFQTPRGTRDFLPDEMAKRRELFEKIRRVFELYGYGEVCTPVFEDFELLAKKSGPEIENEIYAFKDKSGRKLGLRFDPTVPICRIVASNPSIPKPIRFYYITNMWRYDRPGAGRWREFWQAGVELIGSDREEADAEILAVACESMKAVGIKDFCFRINSRKIVESFIKEAGIPESRKFDAFRAIDKLGKIGEKGVRKEMLSYKIPEKAIDKFLRLVKSKRTSGEEVGELENIMKLARVMGVNNVEIDFSIVRGIDYYTGFVFETFVRGFEELGSVASGGRYDTLIGIYSSASTPATGFGIGVDRLMETMKEKKVCLPSDVFVVTVKPELGKESLKIAGKLRSEGISAQTDIMGRNMKKQLEYADAAGIPYAVIVGEKEVRQKKFVLKDMKKRSQKTMGIEKIIKQLRRYSELL